MKNRERQRENRRHKKEAVSFYNHERYADPTPYLAMKNISREARKDSVKLSGQKGAAI